jgi:DNA-directed RNA polymerase alpha subunit
MHGFKNLGQVIKLSRKELLKLRHFGMKCLVEIEDILEPYGLQVGMDISSIPLQETKD